MREKLIIIGNHFVITIIFLTFLSCGSSSEKISNCNLSIESDSLVSLIKEPIDLFKFSTFNCQSHSNVMTCNNYGASLVENIFSSEVPEKEYHLFPYFNRITENFDSSGFTIIYYEFISDFDFDFYKVLIDNKKNLIVDVYIYSLGEWLSDICEISDLDVIANKDSNVLLKMSSHHFRNGEINKAWIVINNIEEDDIVKLPYKKVYLELAKLDSSYYSKAKDFFKKKSKDSLFILYLNLNSNILNNQFEEFIINAFKFRNILNNSIILNLYLGRSYWMINNYDAAIAYFSNIIHSNPQCIIGYISLIDLHLSIGNLTKGESLIYTIIDKFNINKKDLIDMLPEHNDYLINNILY